MGSTRKVFVGDGPPINGDGAGVDAIFDWYRNDDNEIAIESSQALTLANNILTNTAIEIRVYL